MTAPKKKQGPDLPFRKENYIILLVGIGVIILGFLLMTGGGTEDPNKFDHDSLFSFRRITLAPITVVAGYAVVIYAIMKRPRDQTEEKAPSEEGKDA